MVSLAYLGNAVDVDSGGFGGRIAGAESAEVVVVVV
jgi:hypothetical protein